MIIKISRQYKDSLTERALCWGGLTDSRLTYVACKVSPAFLKVAHAQSLTLQIFLLTQSNPEFAE